MSISVVIVTFNEERNLSRTLESLKPLLQTASGEVVIVDSGSTDGTGEIARRFGARVIAEKWRGFAAQKNFALEQAKGEWILSLDADEEIVSELCHEIEGRIDDDGRHRGYLIARRNFFLGRWMRHGGFYPDRKLRLFRRGAARFEERAVHEDAHLSDGSDPGTLKGDILHHAYPTLSEYLEHMNRYSSLGAEMVSQNGRNNRSAMGFTADVIVRPTLTFLYNYLFRLGFLDGREGLLLHMYHAGYVSSKYAKAWELARLTTRNKTTP